MNLIHQEYVHNYLERAKADIEDASPELVGVFTVGSDGVSLTTALLLVKVSADGVGIIESASVLVIHSRVACEEVDSHLEQPSSDPGCRRAIAVTAIGSVTHQQVVAEVEHVVVFVSDAPFGGAKNDSVGGLLSVSLVERGPRNTDET